MPHRLIAVALVFFASTGLASAAPNVLMIAVDDLNDWVGCLGGHPAAATPAIDRLAEQATLFTSAHCQAPICNPSRVSLMTGRRPSTTGVYYLAPYLRDCPATKDLETLSQCFARNGYRTWGVGKILHTRDHTEFQEYGGAFGGFGPAPVEPLAAGHTHPLWDWGPYPERMKVGDARMPDYRSASWAIDKIQNAGDELWFLACGFYRPHVPMCVPQKWFDALPDNLRSASPESPADLDDVPNYAQDLSWSAVAPRHHWFVEHSQIEPATRAYLASVAFVDAQVGRVLDALDASGRRDETIVVLWSDHGFHLGEKARWGKRSLWEESTRVPLIISAPGEPSGQRCDWPVGLIDLYPTLAALCGLAAPEGLEGRSLVPLLDDPTSEWPWPALTTFGQNNHTVRSRRWRYTVYADGSEELYDHETDQPERFNLAGADEYAGVLAEHRRWLPEVNAPMAEGSAHADARPGSAADIDGDR